MTRGEDARIFYGFDELCGRQAFVVGGLVKFQDLQDEYPNYHSRPNLIYLVSSAIPPYAPLMVEIAKERGAKFDLNQNGVAYQAWHGKGWEKTNKTLKALLSMADHVFYQSAFCKKAADRFLGVANGPSDILYNPVNTNIFCPASQRKEIDEPVLITAGTHNKKYRVICAVETIAVLARKGIRAKLIIAGKCNWQDEKAARAEVEYCVKAHNLSGQVEFTGPYQQVEAPSLFAGADILLHAQYNDSCPRLVVEAMACGLPVVYSASGGTPELVGANGGLGVKAPLDWEVEHPPLPDELADCVMQIITDYGTYVANARQRAVSCFDVKPWVERHRDIFKNLLKD
ncbi:MAG: glycosyltransferase family 4 protein [Phycisphaerae bacterium]|nr:glycosyltransferase family 4 protein [Phycisphaerae bacterium]